MGRVDDLLRNYGHGLSSSAATRPRDAGRSAGVDVHRIEVGRIEADPDQPRREFDEARLQELAESLRQHGQLQPIRVRWDSKAAVYRIVAGERRWRASRLAGRPTIDAIVVDDSTSLESIRVEQIVENLQRDDLSKTDTARAYKTLMESWGITARELASRLGVSESTVSRGLGVLKLSEDERKRVDAGEVAVSKAVVKTPRKKKAKRFERHRIRLSAGVTVEISCRPGADLHEVARELLASLEQSRAAA